MLIAGARRHAKEVLEVFHQNGLPDPLYFFDDISADLPEMLFGKFRIMRTLEEAGMLFLEDPEFVLGLGNPYLRKKLSEKLVNAGGILTTVTARSAIIGHYEVNIGAGLNIMHNVMISNCVTIGEGTLVNAYSSLHHDVRTGKYCEISPYSVLLGGCSLGDFCSVGCNAIVLPGIKIGNNVTVGAGAVVNKDLPDNSVAVGVPARVIKIKDL
jgi:sugar O-acyltransferase (sialic acid O-acetyltransferase NeuD family)